MAYDVMLSGVRDKSLDGHVPLSPMGHYELTRVAANMDLPILASLPELYGGDVTTVPLNALQALSAELVQLERVAEENADVAEAVEALRELVSLARRRRTGIVFVPD